MLLVPIISLVFEFTINQRNAKTIILKYLNFNLNIMKKKNYKYLPGEPMYLIQPNKLKTSRPTAKLNSNSYEND